MSYGKSNIATVDYSFLSRELKQLRQENSLYKKAFAQIMDVADHISDGDMTARIVSLNEFGDIAPALSAVNRAYDVLDKFIRNARQSQQAELEKMDKLRKMQLTELADFLEQQIVPALGLISKTIS